GGDDKKNFFFFPGRPPPPPHRGVGGKTPPPAPEFKKKRVKKPLSFFFFGPSVARKAVYMVLPLFFCGGLNFFVFEGAPRMPCSGEKSATSFTSGALLSRSIALFPSRSRPVWFVISPRRLSLSNAKLSRFRTSMPLRVWGMGSEELGASVTASARSPTPDS